LRRLKPFSYFSPRSVAEAVQILEREGPGALPLAGGTDLLVRQKRGDPPPKALINLKQISGLAEIEKQPGGVRIGALTSISALEHSALIRNDYHVLAQAAGLLGSPSIRNLGTIGGNIGRASPASDVAPALIALKARVIAQGPQGIKEFEVERFFRGPGTTFLLPGEVITHFFVPEPAARMAAVYERLGRRAGMDCALVGVAAALALVPGDSEATEVRVALAAVGPVPMRSKKAEEVLLSGSLTAERLKEAARAAAEECMPISDMRASAGYRKDMVRVLALRTLEAALSLARRNGHEHVD